MATPERVPVAIIGSANIGTDLMIKVRQERRDPRRCQSRRHGAGAGNAPLEVLLAAADVYGWQHGCDRRMVGGQEVMITDVALDLVRARDSAPVETVREEKLAS